MILQPAQSAIILTPDLIGAGIKSNGCVPIKSGNRP